MDWSTTDLCDEYAETVRVAEPIFQDFGGRPQFCGPVSTVRAWEDNSLVRTALEEEGDGRVLVVDGGGSRRCAMLGDQLATSPAITAGRVSWSTDACGTRQHCVSSRSVCEPWRRAPCGASNATKDNATYLCDSRH